MDIIYDPMLVLARGVPIAQRELRTARWGLTPRPMRCDSVAYRDPSYGTLVADFLTAMPSAALADAIMRDNAARLYGF